MAKLQYLSKLNGRWVDFTGNDYAHFEDLVRHGYQIRFKPKKKPLSPRGWPEVEAAIKRAKARRRK